MKIIHIIPGSGGTFYCQNCMRDNELVEALKAEGLDVAMVPMYLPLNVDGDEYFNGVPVFYGAINVYLKQVLPIYRKAPVWMEKLFDSPKLLKMAAKQSGSTRASGLEEMTISMLLGEKGNQASELEHLINWLKMVGKPDVVHLSNALLLGLAKKIKSELGIPVVCSLQDENEWIDPMSEHYQNLCWELLTERAKDVDMFVPVSQYYGDVMKQKLNIPNDRIQIVNVGICLDGYTKSSLPMDPPVLGYLCRLSESFGLSILVDAFIKIKQGRYKDIKLYATGGATGDDHKFNEKIRNRLKKYGFDKDFQIFPEFNRTRRIEFLKSLTLMSVPVPAGEAFGTYQIESLAAGVPVVQPHISAFPEIVEFTGGGITYSPNNADALAQAIVGLLDRPEELEQYATNGRKVVYEHFGINHMARNMAAVYKDLYKSVTSDKNQL